MTGRRECYRWWRGFTVVFLQDVAGVFFFTHICMCLYTCRAQLLCLCVEAFFLQSTFSPQARGWEEPSGWWTVFSRLLSKLTNSLLLLLLLLVLISVIGLVQWNIKSYVAMYEHKSNSYAADTMYFLVDKCTCKDILETRLLCRTKAMMCIILRQRKYVFIAMILQVKHMCSVLGQ